MDSCNYSWSNYTVNQKRVCNLLNAWYGYNHCNSHYLNPELIHMLRLDGMNFTMRKSCLVLWSYFTTECRVGGIGSFQGESVHLPV